MNTIQKILNLFNENKDPSLPERFDKYHAENPQVYTSLVSLARQVMENNRSRKIGIGMLYEVLRWQYYLVTDGTEEYKLPNDFRAFYARKIMEQESDLAGCFNTRKSVADLTNK
jgi:hypothetical protein